jgi:hypothetical protein
MMDEILQKLGLKFEDLSSAERDTLNQWMQALNKNSLSIELIRGYVTNMRASVEDELTKTDLNTKQDIFLKARLRNYMLFDAFLSTPAKAKQALEQALSGMVGNVKK